MNYIRHPNAAGAFKLQVHAPFVIVNKIGEALALKYRTPYGQPKNAAGMNIFGRHQLERQQGAAAEEHGKPEEETAFLFAYPNDDRRNRALLRVKDSEWSNPLSLEAVGTATEISFLAGRKMTLENGQDHPVDYRIGMRVSEGTGSVSLLCFSILR
jgi:vacuolar protein sorting-associated protein 13A/C